MLIEKELDGERNGDLLGENDLKGLEFCKSASAIASASFGYYTCGYAVKINS